jgi:hypothetical protein
VVADALDLVEFKAGEAVFAQGEAGDKFYCIKEGTGGRTWVGWKGRKEGEEGEEGGEGGEGEEERKKERREGLLETKALGGAVGCHGCVSTVAKRPPRWKHTLALTLAAAAAAAAACRPTCLPACSGGDVRRRGG